MTEDAATRPVPTALHETANALIQAVQSRALLHDAGEWIAGVKFNLPDKPMRLEVEAIAEAVRQAEERADHLCQRLRRRVEVLREGHARVTGR